MIVCACRVRGPCSKFQEAIDDILTIIRTKIPEPYTFGDLMTHVGWCYELMGTLRSSKLYKKESQGAFATAFQALHNKVHVMLVKLGRGPANSVQTTASFV